VPWPLRGLFAGGATVLVNVAMLAQSRGAAYSLPVVTILFFVIVPGRRRTFAVTAVVGAGLALTLPESLQAALDMRDGQDPGEALREVARPTVIAALAVTAVVAAGAAFETYVRLAPRVERAIGWAVGGLGVATAVAAVVTGLVLGGNPVDRVETAWDQFKDASPVIVPKTGSRLSAGLGSHRYDAYRVALNLFADRPLTGVGADNYAKDYLLYRRSEENLRYPHSLEMRTLSQTGVPGTILLLGAFGFALAAAVQAMRSRRALRAALAGGATMVVVYWLVHGSGDWFWEFAGMGATAFAMLGLACSLAPRRAPADPSAQPLVRGWPAVGAGVVALAAAVSFVLPWLAERDVRRAARGWPINLDVAYDRLDRAESMNPLSDRAALIEGSIALRTGDFDRAERAFTRALERDPGGVYAHLELGAIASERGRRADALRHLQRAAELTPRDRIVRSALARVRSGRRLSIADLNEAILSRANALQR
jgi:tetratricopeptide (TPR) repeat protein